MTPARNYNVIIIGAGAAGLMCAIEAGKRGRKVLVLDHARKVGKKILISGGGRCNFTNDQTQPDRFLSRNPHFCISALRRFTPDDFIALVEKHGIAYHEKKLGQQFCDDSARDIVAMLEDECQAAGVRIELQCEIENIEHDNTGFKLHTSHGAFACDSLVMASGGLSIPKMGATGLAHQVARQFGIKVTQTRPALVPFTLDVQLLEDYSGLSGVSLDTIARCGDAEFRENILFTHKGLSGPAILQISSYWHEGQSIEINLLPDINADAWLLARKQERPKADIRSILTEVFPKRFATRWCESHALGGNMADRSDADLKAIARELQHWTLVPKGTEGYRVAEVTLGGVDTAELSSKTMAATKVPGLYFVGECVDVTGWLGGYNFQWAWASGWCAGQYA